MRWLIIVLLCFALIEMAQLLVIGGGMLCWGPSQCFKSCLIYTLLLAMRGLSALF
jgi:hypothetical protein